MYTYTAINTGPAIKNYILNFADGTNFKYEGIQLICFR